MPSLRPSRLLKYSAEGESATGFVVTRSRIEGISTRYVEIRRRSHSGSGPLAARLSISTACYPKIDLLVNNAGIALLGDQPRRTSADGYELQFAVNYLAGWILVNKLQPNLAAAAPSRVINVASGSAAPIDFDDVMLAKPGAYSAGRTRGYGQSKLAQVSMTIELAPAFAEQNITMISLHPATLMDTTMVKGLGIPPRTTVADGRDHVMGLINRPTLEPGAFYVEGAPTEPSHPQALDPEARARLAALSESLTEVKRRTVEP